jgi:hypothetical protein
MNSLKKNSIVLIALLLLCFQARGAKFKKGEGAEYLMTSSGAKVNVSIYVAQSSFSSIAIEYYFSSPSPLVPISMWQQFTLNLNGKGPLSVDKGYFKTPELKQPQILTQKYMTMNKGVQVHDFLFQDKKELKPFFQGRKKVAVPAGTIEADHYRKSRNGQTIDFWISEQVKPIGLLKLVSSNPKNPKQNYTLELTTLLKNIAPAIDPSKAIPLNKEGEKLLSP